MKQIPLSEIVTVTITTEAYDKLQQLATSEKVRRSVLARKAVRRYLNRPKPIPQTQLKGVKKIVFRLEPRYKVKLNQICLDNELFLSVVIDHIIKTCI